METTSKKRLFIRTTIVSIACIITLAILVITHIYSFLQQEKEHIRDKAIVLFKEAVDEDFQYRSKIITEEISFGSSPVIHSDSSTFKSANLEIKTSVQPNLPFDEKLTDFLQSVLAVKNPINVYQLDTLFQQKLKEKHIHIVTAICLSDTVNKKNNSCTHFNIDSFMPLLTEPFLISTIGISMKAYIKIPQITLIRRMPTLYWIALFGWFLFASSIGYAWYNLRKKIPVLIEDSVKRENILQEELTQKKEELEIFKQHENQKNSPNVHLFSPNLLFEKDTKTLQHHREIVKLTRQQQQLLAAFCNAPEKTCSINDLCNLVWKERVVEENTIHQSISRLNAALRKQELYIEYEFKDSYKLLFKGHPLTTDNE